MAITVNNRVHIPSEILFKITLNEVPINFSELHSLAYCTEYLEQIVSVGIDDPDQLTVLHFVVPEEEYSSVVMTVERILSSTNFAITNFFNIFDYNRDMDGVSDYYDENADQEISYII